MKRFVSFLLAITMVFSMMVNSVVAAGGDVEATASVTSATGAPGELVKVTVSLHGLELNGILSLNVSGLNMENDSKWLLGGAMLSSVDVKRNSAVWMSADSVLQVDGDIFEIWFTVPAPAEGETDFVHEFTCTILEKEDGASSTDTVAVVHGTVTAVNAATGLELSAETLTLDLSGSMEATLVATVTPANSTDVVVWTTSDASVATVENGKVTGHKQGTATITATAGQFSKSCAVTVMCGHDLKETPAKAPTCLEEGNNQYFTCQVCQKVFKADKVTETTAEQEVLAKVAHTFAQVWSADGTHHWYACTTEGCAAQDQHGEHTFVWVTDKEATEDETGLKHEACTVCAYERSVGTVIPVKDHTHIGIVHHEAVAATCTETGNVEYWTCSSSKCAGKYYGDEACTILLDTIVIPVDPANHVGETEVRDAKEANCYQNGYTGDTYCLSCGNVVITGTVIEATGEHKAVSAWTTDETQHWHVCATAGCPAVLDNADHGFAWIIDREATEDETGLMHEACTVCAYERNLGTVIPVKDHEHVGIAHHMAVAATCTETGNVEYWTCSSSKCDGKFYADEKCQVALETIVTPVDPTNHVGQTEVRGQKDENCYQNGYTGDIYCLSCLNVIKEGTVIPATGDHVAAAAWTTDETQHWHVCTTAGCPAVLDNADHGFAWIIDKEATEDETGLKHEECAVCAYQRSVGTVIEKLDHVHVGVTYHGPKTATCVEPGNVAYWTCSSPKCEGKFYEDAQCQIELASVVTPIDPTNHGETEDRGAKEANCYQPGYTGDTYCLRCENVAVYGTVIPATGDHVAAAAWTTDETRHWHVCATAGCPAVLDEAEHGFAWVVDQEATEDETGLKHEECTVCAYQRNVGTVIEKLDHVHVGITCHDAVAATCVSTGNVEYWTCSSSKCDGKFYADEKCQVELETIVTPVDPTNHGETEVRDAKEANCYQPGYTGDTYCTVCKNVVAYGTVIPATGDHVASAEWIFDENDHWNTCTTEGCGAILNKTTHTLEWKVDVPATEDEIGFKHEECNVCAFICNENTIIEKLDHVHIGVECHEAVAATCTTTGNVEYWTCASSKCDGKFYADEQCLIELETIVTEIDPENHVKTVVRDDKAPSCYEEGYTGDTYCTACGVKVSEGTAIAPTGEHVAGSEWYSDEENHWHLCATEGCEALVEVTAHEFEAVIDREATEDETGLMHEECVCGVKRNEGTVIDKLAHTHVRIVHHAAVDATCVSTGTVEYWTCSSLKCIGKFYADSKCQVELESIVTAIDPANHGKTVCKDAKDPTCAEAGYTGDTYCTDCKALVKQGSAVAATGNHNAKKGYKSDDHNHWQVCADCGNVIESTKKAHGYEWITDKKATESAMGKKHEECSVCKHTRNEGTPIAKLKHNPVLVAAKDATCTENGNVAHYYCQTCGNYYAFKDGKVGDRINKSAIVVAATGHSFDEAWLTDGENHWHACQCGEIADKAAHTLELVGVIEAADGQDGYTGDSVCSVCAYVAEMGEAVSAVEEPTETPTDAEEPTEAPVGDIVEEPAQQKSNGVIWIVVLAAAACVAVAVPVVLKRKKK